MEIQRYGNQPDSLKPTPLSYPPPTDPETIESINRCVEEFKSETEKFQQAREILALKTSSSSSHPSRLKNHPSNPKVLALMEKLKNDLPTRN